MRASFFFRFMILSLALGFAACGSGTSESSGGAGSSGSTGSAPIGGGAGGSTSSGSSTAPSASAPYGVFEIHYATGSGSSPSYTDITGLMRDGMTTELVVWEKKKTDGDCALYTPRIPFCEACASPQVCVADNVCRTPPSSYSIGNVTLTGLNGSNPLELTPISSAANTDTKYLCAETLPLPPCTAGASISLVATGEGQFPAFSIAGKCIAPLVVANATIAIESGKDFTLTWTPGAVADARIGLEFDLSHHGGSKGRLLCDTADSGSLKVSGTLIKSLMDLGVTGFPKAEVKRVFTGKSAVGTGTAELRLRANLEFVAEIPGLKSCNSGADCIAPETCQEPGKMCGVSCATSADCPTGKTCLTSTKVCK
jgi:hypothetical protein